MKRFHAHIYFEQKKLKLARAVADRALMVGLFETVQLHELPIGPHPKGMIEIHFSEHTYCAAVEWIVTHRGMFSVLIHQETGDDFKDHTDGIQWLGTSLSLDFSFFELIRSQPHLRVHPELKQFKR